MKKHAKLLCAILVLSILCSALFFVVGAEETEPFVKSFEAVDYNGKSINNGTTIAKSTVAGNRVTSISTMNASDSAFISIAQGVTDNPYLIAYANRDVNEQITSGNNLAFSVGTATSDPFTVVGEDAVGYYVVDFDVATHGNLLPDFDVSVVLRRATDGSGYPFSDEIMVGNFITATDEWSHVTIIGDIANNVAKVYVNGVYAGDGGKAVRNDVSNANQLNGQTEVKALGFRVEFTRNNIKASFSEGDNATFDNFAHRLYINDYSALAAAVAKGDITGWEGYTAGRGGELMPVVATVDGVEYRNFNDLSKAFSTNDVVNVDFLAEPFVPVSLCANAVINTNGMDADDLFSLTSECEIQSVNGNIVTTTSPFVSNYGESAITPANAAKVVKYSHPDNILSYFTPNNYDVASGRTMKQVFDTYTGVSYVNERPYSTAVNDSSNTYNGWFPSGGKITYVKGQDQHVVIDFDIAMNDTNPYLLKTITRTSSGGSAWGDNDLSLNTLYSGHELGEFVHITIVLSTDTKAATVFVNGEHVLTKASVITDNSNHYFESLRTGGNSNADVSFANVCIRNVKDGELTSAVGSKNISIWSGNIYDGSYKLPSPPSILAIDGAAYYDKAGAELALFGNRETPTVVKVLNAFTETITVNCDAIIYTYGQDVKFVDVKGKALTPNENNIIVLDVPFMSVRQEVEMSVSDGTDNSTVLSAVKAAVKGNRLSAFTHSAGQWGSVGYRNASLVTNIETGDVVYRNFANLTAAGKLDASSGEYVDMEFTAVTLQKKDGENEYVVVDFDFGTDGVISDDVAIKLGDFTGKVLLGELGILAGDMAHVTVVFDLQSNAAEAFVNGLYTRTFENAMFESSAFGNYNGGASTTVNKVVLSTEQKISTVCLDNVAVRFFELDAAADPLAGIADSGDITEWADSIYNSDYKVSKLPTLAVVDGREYGSVYTLNNLLAIKTDYVKSVEMKYSPLTEVKILTEASVETHGLDINMNWNTGLHMFNPGNRRYENKGADGEYKGYAYASTKFVCTTVDTVYKFTEINADNCWSNATVAIWAYDYDFDFNVYDVVFYPHGEVMSPIDTGEYVKDGYKYVSQWIDVISGTFDIVTDFPTAGPTETMKIYGYEPIKIDASKYAAKNMMYSANISTDITFTFYVAANETVSDTGRTVDIGGVTYVAFDFKLAPHEIDKVITVSFNVKNQHGAVYEQRQEICFVDYARKLLESDRADVDKALLVSLLNYANEASALFNGGTSAMKSVEELVESYFELLTNEELTEKIDTTELSSVIRSAAMRLNSTPDFIFKVGRGFRGTVTLSYEGLDGAVEKSVYINTLASEQTIVLTGLNVYDVSATVTITVTADGSEEPIVGQYNLATYAQSLEDNAFAVALYNYSKLAQAYKNGNPAPDFSVEYDG